MSRRRILLIAGLLAGVAAGVLYQSSTQRTQVVVAARALDALRPLEIGDLAVRDFPSDSLPAGTERDPARIVGRYLRAPVAGGQLVLAGTIADQASQFSSGLRPPAGTRAIAVPVSPAHALGGAIVAGTRIDVIAVPIAGKAPPDRAIEVVAEEALVLDVRTDTGQALGRDSRGQLATLERLGSIVVAVPEGYELLIADRIPTSTFVLALGAR